MTQQKTSGLKIREERPATAAVQGLTATHVLKDPVSREVISSQVPDVKTRMEAADRIARLFGQVPAAVEMPPPPPPGLTVTITVQDPKQPEAPAIIIPPPGDERPYASPVNLQLRTDPAGPSRHPSSHTSRPPSRSSSTDMTEQ